MIFTNTEVKVFVYYLRSFSTAYIAVLVILSRRVHCKTVQHETFARPVSLPIVRHSGDHTELRQTL